MSHSVDKGPTETGCNGHMGPAPLKRLMLSEANRRSSGNARPSRRFKCLQLDFPTGHGKPRGDARRMLNGIVFVNNNSCGDVTRSCYGLCNTLYNRWKQWGERGVFVSMMEGLADAEGEPRRL